MISIETQLSLFLDNRPGTLARTCEALAKASINILAMSIYDMVDQAIVRMVVSDAKQAVAILQRLHASVYEKEVIVMRIPNKPGAIALIAQRLAAAGINLEYAYCTSSPHEMGHMVLRTNNLEETINALTELEK